MIVLKIMTPVTEKRETYWLHKAIHRKNELKIDHFLNVLLN